MAAKCLCHNHRDQTASADGATSSSENVNFANLVSINSFFLHKGIFTTSSHRSVNQVPTDPR